MSSDQEKLPKQDKPLATILKSKCDLLPWMTSIVTFRANERAEQNLKCNKNFSAPISNDLQDQFEALFDLQHSQENIEQAMEAVGDLMEEYLTGGVGSNCKQWKSWPKRAKKVYTKVQNTIA